MFLLGKAARSPQFQTDLVQISAPAQTNRVPCWGLTTLCPNPSLQGVCFAVSPRTLTKSRLWHYLCSSDSQGKHRKWNIGIPCVTEIPFFFYPLLAQREKSWIQRAVRKEQNQICCLADPNSRSENLTCLVAHTHVHTGVKCWQTTSFCPRCRCYLLILVSYSVLCLLSSVFSSTTKLCRALEHLTESLEAAARLLCSLLLLLHASNLSMLFSRSAVLTSLWDSEPWVIHSVLRELRAEESLARQAGQLLTESITEISHDDVDHVVLAILCVLRERLDEGTLS